MMLDDIQPGTTVQVTVVKNPTNEAAAKTLVRLLYKDAHNQALNHHLRKVRASQYQPRPRGGRMYGGQMVKLHPVQAKPGQAGKIRATVDVLRDLKSVSRFIEVAAV